MSATPSQFPEPARMPRMYQDGQAVPREDESLTWQDQALCAQVGGDAWFPERGVREAITTQDAKRICSTCPVAAQCLQYALDTDQRFGLWGGLSTKQRDKLRAGTPQHTVTHGTNAMYNRGCHDETTCPRSDKGTSCSEAHRRYDRKRRSTQGSAA